MLEMIPRCLVGVVGLAALGPLLVDALRFGRTAEFTSTVLSLVFVALIGAFVPKPPPGLVLRPVVALTLLVASAIGSYAMLLQLQIHVERLLGG